MAKKVNLNNILSKMVLWSSLHEFGELDKIDSLSDNSEANFNKLNSHFDGKYDTMR